MRVTSFQTFAGSPVKLMLLYIPYLFQIQQEPSVPGQVCASTAWSAAFQQHFGAAFCALRKSET